MSIMREDAFAFFDAMGTVEAFTEGPVCQWIETVEFNQNLADFVDFKWYAFTNAHHTVVYDAELICGNQKISTIVQRSDEGSEVQADTIEAGNIGFIVKSDSIRGINIPRGKVQIIIKKVQMSVHQFMIFAPIYQHSICFVNGKQIEMNSTRNWLIPVSLSAGVAKCGPLAIVTPPSPAQETKSNAVLAIVLDEQSAEEECWFRVQEAVNALIRSLSNDVECFVISGEQILFHIEENTPILERPIVETPSKRVETAARGLLTAFNLNVPGKILKILLMNENHHRWDYSREFNLFKVNQTRKYRHNVPIYTFGYYSSEENNVFDFHDFNQTPELVISNLFHFEEPCLVDVDLEPAEFSSSQPRTGAIPFIIKTSADDLILTGRVRDEQFEEVFHVSQSELDQTAVLSLFNIQQFQSLTEAPYNNPQDPELVSFALTNSILCNWTCRIGCSNETQPNWEQYPRFKAVMPPCCPPPCAPKCPIVPLIGELMIFRTIINMKWEDPKAISQATGVVFPQLNLENKARIMLQLMCILKNKASSKRTVWGPIYKGLKKELQSAFPEIQIKSILHHMDN